MSTSVPASVNPATVTTLPSSTLGFANVPTAFATSRRTSSTPTTPTRAALDVDNCAAVVSSKGRSAAVTPATVSCLRCTVTITCWVSPLWKLSASVGVNVAVTTCWPAGSFVPTPIGAPAAAYA